MRCRFGTWFAGLVGAWLACWFPESVFPLGACCLHSFPLFTTYRFVLVVISFWAAFGSSLCYCRCSFSRLGLCLHACECMRRLSFPAHPGGSGVQHDWGLSTNMAEATCFFSCSCSFSFAVFFLALGFWEAKWLLFSHYLCLELGYGRKEFGEQANIKRVIGV